jgi:hypothetical protein
MKINNIIATDYKVLDGVLVIDFTDTTEKKVLALDTSELTVTTDGGDEVETLTGFSVKQSLVVDLKNTGSFTLALEPADPMDGAFTSEELETLIVEAANAALDGEVSV